MSKIDKLQILGVRSFDNMRSEVIQFYSPLTLIVGYNGSGKTTIVECLKYATSGELPPNSKGGAFIHDPKLAGEKEVLAQVKLSFQATSGIHMVTSRSLQLTVKKTARSVKTLEGHLTIRKDGEKTDISTRVAELDQIIPQYLGVSTAILDNVIFCHQDESLWPLSEPSVLKKKFDEIFEAQKYTKAIDNIKQLRKKQNEELGKFKLIEKHTKEDKDKGEKIRKRMLRLSNEIEEIRGDVTGLTAEMAQARDLADKAWKESEEYAKILGQLEGKKIQADGKANIINDLRVNLKEVPESDEWLESTLEQYESRLAQYREQEDSKKEAYMDLKQQVQSSRQQLGLKQKKFGEYENDKAQYERNLVKRQDLVKEVARNHSIRGFNDSIDDDQFADFMQRLRKLLKDQTNLLNKVKQEGSTELREVQTVRNQLDRREEALQHDKQSARQQMASNEDQISHLQAQADQISVDEGSKVVIESRIEDVNVRLQKTRTAAEQANRDEQINMANVQLRSQEEENFRLNEDLIQGTKRASEMAQLDHLKKEVKDKSRSLETILGAHRDRITKHIGPEWEPSTVDSMFQTSVNERNRDHNDAERNREAVSRDLEQTEFKLKTVRANLKQKNTELAQAKTKIRKAIEDEPEEFEVLLEERQGRLDVLKTDASEFTGLQDYMRKCLVGAAEKNCCRTCMRPFRTPQESTTFKNRIEGLIQKAQQEVSQEEIKQAEEDLDAARAAATHYDTWKRLSNIEVPDLTEQEQRLEAERQNLLAKIEEHDLVVSEKAVAKRDLESLSKTVDTISKYDIDIKNLGKQVQDLTARQSQSQQGHIRTLEDIQDEISALAERMRTTKQLITKLTNDRDNSRTEISDLELEFRDLKAELSKAGFQMERKTGLISRIEEIKTMNQKQRENIQKADRDLERLGPQIAQAKTRYDDTLERTQNREAEVQRCASSLSEATHQLDLSNDQIRSYIERDGPRELSRAQREIKNFEEEIGRLEAEQSSVTVEINRIATQLHDSESTKRQYSDNLRYRREVRALDQLNAEISQLASHNAEVDRNRFQRESEKRTKEYNALSARQAGKMGEMKSKDNHLKEMITEWETTYKDAAKQYQEAHIRVETSKAAIEDLGRYGGALDKAIMTYHSLKMEEINRIIEELWRDTYRGTDVDTILIRSDNENAKGNRSYNYRVCMVKQGAEMDMRGRCSAGQKVLASIIIRLALAECFGTNCGIIALDEPTTNLDQDNVRSLAQSLHDIINVRRQQANFQLIVITHDEEFLRSMQCGDFTDYYWRVSRNEKLKSIIERQNIAEVL